MGAPGRATWQRRCHRLLFLIEVLITLPAARQRRVMRDLFIVLVLVLDDVKREA